MELIHGLIQERNEFETLPFVDIHKSNFNLSATVRKLQTKCHALETECHHQQQDLRQVRRILDDFGCLACGGFEISAEFNKQIIPSSVSP